MKDSGEYKLTPAESLEQQQRIAERDPLAKFPGFDTKGAADLDNKLIEASPVAYDRLHQNEGLDAGTEKKLNQALRRNRGDGGE